MPRFTDAMIKTAGELLSAFRIQPGESFEQTIARLHQHLVGTLGESVLNHGGDGLDELLTQAGWFGPLQGLMDDDEVTVIQVRWPGEPIIVERGGRQMRLNMTLSAEWIRFIAARFRQRRGFTVSLPVYHTGTLVSPPLRYTYVSPVFSAAGDTLYIRKFRRYPIPFEDQIRSGTMTRELAQFLMGIVRGRANILISGGSGAGKTTLMTTMALAIPPEERVIAVEDEHELYLEKALPNFTPLELNPDYRETTMSDLLRHVGLKVAPNRVLVGEVRGKEAFDLMQAMNTGIDGSMATIHANSPVDALKKWADYVTMAETAMPQAVIYSRIAEVKPVVVQINRLPTGERVVSGVVECLSSSKATFETAALFALDDKTRPVRTRTPFSPHLADRLAAVKATEYREAVRS
jgi:pilus assembly protein CpaF